MNIGEQFKGLDMKNLIGGPLTAAAESSLMLARTTAEFINQVGFDADQKARTVLFKYNKQEPGEDGGLISQEMSIDIPLLAIVPIPNLQIDEVNIMFDMEVKDCVKEESSMSGSGSFSAKVGWGPISVSVSGSVSAHSSNTRSTDKSAKYHVDVRATNHGTPEGLARVLDMMAASVSPNLIGSRPTDQSGAELTGDRRERSQKLRALREKSMQLESAESAARDSRDIKLNAFARKAQSLQELARNKFSSDMANEKDDKKKLSEDPMNSFWNDLQIGARQKVTLAASLTGDEAKIATLCPPVKVDDKDYTSYTTASTAENEFTAAIKAHIEWEKSQKAVEDNKTEYNSVMMGVAVAK
ncbi:MAG: DUF2589 domain-containing protein [Chitinispirillales bacterium]|jgi:hypothetical protein|nr:DUF2589 domain-containing protein [Chitinispirillales bacterium]